MNQKNQLRKNPSRETCESIIRRILMTELTQNGKNRHFRKAADFMSYWEIICRCKCLPPSNGTGRDRFPVRTLPYAGTSAAYIRTE